MALAKRIKIGGSYYKGEKCVVGAGAGDYTVVITTPTGAAVNSISITPSAYGAGDTMKIEHFDDLLGAGELLAILMEGVYNTGARATTNLDFPAAELLNKGECLVFTYTNVAGVAMDIYLTIEFVGIKKTT